MLIPHDPLDNARILRFISLHQKLCMPLDTITQNYIHNNNKIDFLMEKRNVTIHTTKYHKLQISQERKANGCTV